MTRDDHPSGSDRVAEVTARIGGADDDLVLNVQGDEPEINPDHLQRLIERMQQDAAPVGTLACPFPEEHYPRDANCVKVVLNRAGRAMYFSRALIPYPRVESGDEGGREAFLLHIGVYAYRRAFLLSLADLLPTPLERIERLEQLRILEHGHAIAVEVVDSCAVGIDTPEDYEKFVARYSAPPVG
jgi:3-deoxy-manno-octulosonate cytidylyltransferase (CMP-KDO synthetase)